MGFTGILEQDAKGSSTSCNFTPSPASCLMTCFLLFTAGHWFLSWAERLWSDNTFAGGAQHFATALPPGQGPWREVPVKVSQLTKMWKHSALLVYILHNSFALIAVFFVVCFFLQSAWKLSQKATTCMSSKEKEQTFPVGQAGWVCTCSWLSSSGRWFLVCVPALPAEGRTFTSG